MGWAVNAGPAHPGLCGRNLPHDGANVLSVDAYVRELAQEQPPLDGLGYAPTVVCVWAVCAAFPREPYQTVDKLLLILGHWTSPWNSLGRYSFLGKLLLTRSLNWAVPVTRPRFDLTSRRVRPPRMNCGSVRSLAMYSL